MTIHLNILLPDNSTDTLDIAPDSTVKQLKDAIQNMNPSYPADNQTLTYQGDEINDDETLQQLEIDDEDMIILTTKQAAQKIGINFRPKNAHDGKKGTYQQFDPNATILTVITLLRIQLETNVGDLKLWFNNLELTNQATTLADLQVPNDGEIQYSIPSKAPAPVPANPPIAAPPHLPINQPQPVRLAPQLPVKLVQDRIVPQDPQVQANGKIKVFVESTHNGQQIQMEVDPNWDVREFKRQLSEIPGKPFSYDPTQHVFKYADDWIYEGQSLGHFKLTAGGIISLVNREVGG